MIRTILKALLCLVLFCTVAFGDAPLRFVTGEGISTAEAATVTLHYGSRGWRVTQLQKHLRTTGYFYFPRNTGYFGPITRQSVRHFQRAYGIRVDGIAGPVTLRHLQHAVVKKHLVNDSTRYRGVPYVWGGETPKGFDCSGFIYYMFRKHGVYVSRHTAQQLFHTGRWVSRSSLRPGDLVFFALESPRHVSHVGFYLGNNKFISATSSRGVWIYQLNTSYWAPHYVGGRRIY
jgi:hypothetical protein